MPEFILKETYVEKIIDLKKIRKSLIPNQRNCFKKQENTVMMIDIVILRQMKEGISFLKSYI